MDKIEDDNLEYNDGLGDMLRQKEKLEFSWFKTLVSLAVIFALVFSLVYVLFSLGKSVFTGSSSIYRTKDVSTQEGIVPTSDSTLASESSSQISESETTSDHATQSDFDDVIVIGKKGAPSKPKNTVPVEASPSDHPPKSKKSVTVIVPAPAPTTSRIKPKLNLMSSSSPQRKLASKRASEIPAYAGMTDKKTGMTDKKVGIKDKKTGVADKKTRLKDKKTIITETKAVAPERKVEIDPTFVGPLAPSDYASSRPFKVIVGSFSKKEYALDMILKLQKIGVSAFSFQESSGAFRVQAGAFSTREDAKRHQQFLTSKGVSDHFVISR